tara:strand:+ start:3150 stop:3560 length:411 start_codon:yes stop_codon:yes gene_type:complete
MALIPDVKITIKEKTEDLKRVYFHVKAPIGTQRSRSVAFKTKTVVFTAYDVIEEIKNNFDIEELNFLPGESLKTLKFGASKGVCVFEKKNAVDKSEKSVNILESEKKSKAPLERKTDKHVKSKRKDKLYKPTATKK